MFIVKWILLMFSYVGNRKPDMQIYFQMSKYMTAIFINVQSDVEMLKPAFWKLLLITTNILHTKDVNVKVQENIHFSKILKWTNDVR